MQSIFPDSSKTVIAARSCVSSEKIVGWHEVRLKLRNERTKRAMIKTLDLITEAIRNPKNTFRKLADRPRKAEKHRYERRKVKEVLRLGEWGEESPI